MAVTKEIRRLAPEQLPAKAKIVRYWYHSYGTTYLSWFNRRDLHRTADELKNGTKSPDVIFFNLFPVSAQIATELAYKWRKKHQMMVQLNDMFSPNLEAIIHIYRKNHPGERSEYLQWLKEEERLDDPIFVNMCHQARKGLEQTFRYLQPGQRGLAINSPYPFALIMHCCEKRQDMPENNFFDFTELNGEIYYIQP